MIDDVEHYAMPVDASGDGPAEGDEIARIACACGNDECTKWKLTSITVDPVALSVIISALDLYQRIAMGQWREIPLACVGLVDDDETSPWGRLGDQLMNLRCAYASDPNLQMYSNAFLGIRRAHRGAQIAYDIWHQCGGGMESRRDDRITDAHVEVSYG